MLAATGVGVLAEFPLLQAAKAKLKHKLPANKPIKRRIERRFMAFEKSCSHKGMFNRADHLVIKILTSVQNSS